MKNLLALLLLLLNIVLFFASCILAASDANGALLFLPLLLVFLLLPFLAWLLSRNSEKRRNPRPFILAELGFVLIFYLAIFVPPLRFIPDGVMWASVTTFTKITGRSPYEWAHRKINH